MRIVSSALLKANQNYASRQYLTKEYGPRTKFERDRDRLLYAKAFRRLSGKTQVFLSRYSPHIRNRLTHTLEVAQISKAIAKQLFIDIDLVEAISLGHDLGHTPFGHVGERTLNNIIGGKLIDIPEDVKKGSFKHNLNGLYIVNSFEKKSREFYGLNLCDYTIFGIIDHSSRRYKNDKEELYQYYTDLENECLRKDSWTFESYVVKMADEIAQRHHDIEDGLIAKIITKEEIIELIEDKYLHLFNKSQRSRFNKNKNEDDDGYFISELSSIVVDFLVNNIIQATKDRMLTLVRNYGITTNEVFNKIKNEIEVSRDEIVNFDQETINIDGDMQRFLKNRILSSYEVQSLDGKGEYIIKKIFQAYWSNPQQLSNGALIQIYIDYNDRFEIKTVDKTTMGMIREKIKEERLNPDFQNVLLRGIVNHISTMTDDYAYSEFDKLYGTKIIG